MAAPMAKPSVAEKIGAIQGRYQVRARRWLNTGLIAVSAELLWRSENLTDGSGYSRADIIVD
jgi:hypothetical protein